MATKTFAFSSKNKDFLLKRTKFGPKLAFLVILGQALPAHLVPFWCLWHEGCISQDTYLLYIIYINHYSVHLPPRLQVPPHPVQPSSLQVILSSNNLQKVSQSSSKSVSIVVKGRNNCNCGICNATYQPISMSGPPHREKAATIPSREYPGKALTFWEETKKIFLACWEAKF